MGKRRKRKQKPIEGKKHAVLSDSEKQSVINYFYNNHNNTSREIAKATGVAQTTVDNIINKHLKSKNKK